MNDDVPAGHPAGAGDADGRDAEATLSHVRDVRRRVRARAHGGVWFPVAVIAALLLLSIGLYAAPFGRPYASGTAVLGPRTPFWAGLPAAQRDPVLSYGFWFLGTPAAFGLIAWWYRRRARGVGMTVAWRRVLAVGLGALAALAVLAAAPVRVALPFSAGDQLDWRQGLLTPLLPVALALIALGLVERGVTLAVSGAWIGVIAWWYGAAGMGRLPGWLTFVLGGFSGPALGGSVALFDRPGPVLFAMALPLVLYALARGLWSRRAAS